MEQQIETKIAIYEEVVSSSIFVPNYLFSFPKIIEFIHKKTSSQIKEQNIQIITSKNRLLNLAYDLANFHKMPIYHQKTNTPIIKKDTTKYDIIANNQNLYSLDLFNILKRLLSANSINRFQYKESIKRLNNSKELRNNVYEKVSMFLRNCNKAITTKSSMASADRTHKNLTFIHTTQKINGHKYQIRLKKNLTYYRENDLKNEVITKIQKSNNFIV